jgi:hypothetical protein
MGVLMRNSKATLHKAELRKESLLMLHRLTLLIVKETLSSNLALMRKKMKSPLSNLIISKVTVAVNQRK